MKRTCDGGRMLHSFIQVTARTALVAVFSNVKTVVGIDNMYFYWALCRKSARYEELT